MHEDGTVTTDTYTASDMIVAPNLVGACGDRHDHGLKDFLRRPVIMKQGVWDQSSAEGVELWSADFPSALLTSTYKQNTEKVRGFVAMRARVRIRVQVNSEPTQSGIAILSYLPFSEYIPQHSNWYYKSLPVSAPTRADMVAVTALSHTRINLANQTATEFVIPYLSPYIYVNLVTGQGTFGKIALHSLVPVSTGSASTTVNYTVFANLEDVELQWPTDAPLTTKWAQIGTEIEDMERTGAISSIVNRAGGVIADVLPHVGLGWLSKPVGLFSTAASNVLKMFGFSKPTIQAPVTRVLQAPARNFLNCDGSDTSHVLGLSAANELQTMTGFAGTDEDEMQLAYIAARPSFFTTFDWKASNKADDALAQFDLTPYAMSKTSAEEAGKKGFIDRLTPAARMASLFAMWNGDLVYDLEFSKTQMHSGRLRVSARMYNYTLGSAELDNNPGFTITDDIDLSTCSRFRIRIPFKSVRPWLLTAFERKSVAGADLWNNSMGLLQISVLNPLVGPSIVSQTVSVAVFGHMEHAQFAVPIKPTVLPYGLPALATTSRAEMAAPKSKEEPIVTSREFTYVPLRVAQMGLVEEMKPGSQDTAHKPNLLVAPQSTCTGEIVTSLRQYLKRFTKVRQIKPTARAATTTVNGSSGNCLTIRPWAPCPVATGTVTATAPQYYDTDSFSLIAPMFAFLRGGMRFKIVIDVESAGFKRNIPMTVLINNNLTKKIPAQPTGLESGEWPVYLCDDIPKTSTGSLVYQPGFADVVMPIFFDYEGVAEFQVPYYSTGHMAGVRYGVSAVEDRRTSKVPIPMITLFHPSFVNSTISIYRAVADDFSFGGLLGSPQVIDMAYNTAPV
jgi:hypothetical protein